MRIRRHVAALPAAIILGLAMTASAAPRPPGATAPLRPVNPPGPAIPGISQAMLIGSGQLLVLSGHVPIDSEGRIPAGLSAQLDQVFRNLQATLHAAGTDFGSVARLTLYVRGYEPSQLAQIRAVRDRWITVDRPPASALIGVAALFHPGVLVEVDALAVVREQ